MSINAVKGVEIGAGFAASVSSKKAPSTAMKLRPEGFLVE